MIRNFVKKFLRKKNTKKNIRSSTCTQQYEIYESTNLFKHPNDVAFVKHKITQWRAQRNEMLKSK